LVARRLALAALPWADAPLAAILDLWRDSSQGGRLPRRAALDLARRAPLFRSASFVHLIDCEADDPRGFFFELYDSRTDIFRGADFTRRRLAEIPCPLYAADVQATYGAVKAERAPTLHATRTHVLGHATGYARLVLPLSRDGRTVDQLLVAINKRSLPELDLDDAPTVAA
jgi:hypothetical protein